MSTYRGTAHGSRAAPEKWPSKSNPRCARPDTFDPMDLISLTLGRISPRHRTLREWVEIYMPLLDAREGKWRVVALPSNTPEA